MTDRGPAMEEPSETGDGLGIHPPGYRLPKQISLGPVVLQVADKARSVEFYEGVLGLRAGDVEEAGEVVLTDAGNSPLVVLRERRGAAAAPRGGRPGLYHYALLLPGRPALGALLAHLGRLGIRAGMADHDVSEALYLSDPDGHGIEVYTDRPRSEWRTSGREIHMTTAPLDVAALLEAGVGGWQGMPAGTSMGHVHLHVGEIEEAASFYHAGLGLDRVVWSYPGALFLSAGGYHHHLGVNVWARSAEPAGEDDARLLEWQMILPDGESLAAVAGSVEAAGFQVRKEDETVVVDDPWGTRLRLTTCSGKAAR